MHENILHAYAFNLGYARKLVGDVPDERMAEQPAGIPNHAAWIIGHLANTCDFAGQQLGLDPISPNQWAERFGNGSVPVADRSKYPAKAALLKALEDGHARVAEALGKADPKALEAENPVEGLRPAAPTVRDLLTFILTTHEAIHLGQLSAWRRAAGFGSVF